MNRILVIGDCHIDEDQDLSRFDLLAKLILDEQPTHIVFMGDFLTLNCLSAWDMNKRALMEGRRYKAEIDIGNSALDRLLIPIEFYNIERRQQHKKQYQPQLIYLEGNHEDRLTRYLESDPTFAGFVSVEHDLRLTDRGFQYVPYRKYIYIGGIGFTHIPHNEVKPITGIYHVHKASQCTINSVVYGHTHKFEVLCRHVEGMAHLQQILSAGCFFEKHEPYVDGRITHYFKGVFILENYKEGRYDLTSYSLGRLRRMYASYNRPIDRENSGEVRSG